MFGIFMLNVDECSMSEFREYSMYFQKMEKSWIFAYMFAKICMSYMYTKIFTCIYENTSYHSHVRKYTCSKSSGLGRAAWRGLRAAAARAREAGLAPGLKLPVKYHQN